MAEKLSFGDRSTDNDRVSERDSCNWDRNMIGVDIIKGIEYSIEL
jgi:hypothetical protein